MSSQKLRKFTGIFSAVCGGLLISVPVISQTALAQQPTSVKPQQSTSKVNPCPSIFYEEPHNNRVVVPQGCPPNALTQRLANQGLLPANGTPTTSSTYQTGLGVGGETPQAGGTLNPCPRIYYEEPFNSRNVVPQGCPPNAFSQGQGNISSQGVPVTPQTSISGTTTPQTTLPSPGETSNQGVPVNPQVSTSETTTTQTPPPSQQQTPSATIALANGKVDVKLINDTGAKVTYQVIGDTEARSLEGKSNVMLQGISAPVTVTFQREDGGLLSVTPQASTEQPGMLEVTLNEATDLSQDTKAMRIQQNGSVFLN
ncbi:hypothetical protein ACX27_07380 [Nostoc piscinale CENA21]|uniref:Uncharacterized protein n=1 Tax=Nostoc piscinale CENA21 TaxID=224013 RepID=A0A0M4TV13_9NOSO|nr:hypothetical protein [Nostoc piscinale]ALF52714.1 hypothetical protein ACX27_07380 [Nostoc piscinale CENA21]